MKIISRGALPLGGYSWKQDRVYERQNVRLGSEQKKTDFFLFFFEVTFCRARAHIQKS